MNPLDKTKLRMLAITATPLSGIRIDPGNPVWGPRLRKFQEFVTPTMVLELLDELQSAEAHKKRTRRARR